jgi:hypothetical protein
MDQARTKDGLLDQATGAAARYARRAVRSAEYADLAGDSGLAELKRSRRALAGILREARETIDGAIFCHQNAHSWGDNDYCNRCGADGRA